MPERAAARAVHAATEVFPTPPLPVYRIVRGRMTPRVYELFRLPDTCSVSMIRLKFPGRSVAARRTV